jgi:transposase|tara:strand:- start:247 stop:1503 length:1257 start_codon:yes stop_codon:yes gene_type:complete
MMEEEERNWFVGVDWASETHQVCLLDVHGQKLGERSFAHGGAGLAAMADWILALTGAAPDEIHVAIEVPHGPVVESLMERGLKVHAINPKQLDRFRDRFSPAGAKDDSRDAQVLGDALRTDPHCLRRLVPLDPVVIELREWSRITEELTQDRTRLTNRLREQLWRYYPQILEVTDDLAQPWFLELWARVPTPDAARRVRLDTLARILKRHRIRRLDATGLRDRLRAPALVVAPGTTEAATAHIKPLGKRLALVNRQLRQAEARLDQLTERLASNRQKGPGQKGEQRDVTILASLPGIGRIVLATLLAEAFDPLQRRDYHALRCLSGVAPVTKRSGKSKIVIRRLAAHVRLANAAYHWARVAVQHDPKSRAKYTALRQRGHGHARALRSVADRLLAVACAMLESQTLFDPDHPTQSQAP